MSQRNSATPRSLISEKSLSCSLILSLPFTVKSSEPDRLKRFWRPKKWLEHRVSSMFLADPLIGVSTRKPIQVHEITLSLIHI